MPAILLSSPPQVRACRSEGQSAPASTGGVLQTPPTQAWPLQEIPQPPQFRPSIAESTSQPSAALRLQSLNAPPQASVHLVPSQPAVELGPDGHTVPQVVPQLLTSLFSAQIAPHAWCVESQVKPHPSGLPPHVGVPKAGATQAVHELPQLPVLLFATQVLPQAWNPAMQTKPQAPCALHVAMA